MVVWFILFILPITGPYSHWNSHVTKVIKLLAYDSIKASGEANMRPKHSIKHYKQQNKL